MPDLLILSILLSLAGSRAFSLGLLLQESSVPWLNKFPETPVEAMTRGRLDPLLGWF
jgi:hypothetical protein